MLIFLSFLLTVCQGIVLKQDSHALCISNNSTFAIALNMTTWSEAEHACKRFGRRLAVLDCADEFFQISRLMKNCSVPLGNQIISGWINKNQPKIFKRYEEFKWDCMAIDFRSGIVPGAGEFCTNVLNMTMYTICRDDGDVSELTDSSESEEDAPSPNKKQENEERYTPLLPTALTVHIPGITLSMPTNIDLPPISIPISFDHINLHPPYHLASTFNYTVVASIGNLRIVTTDSLSPRGACKALGFELGRLNHKNLAYVTFWCNDYKKIATFVNSEGKLHFVAPDEMADGLAKMQKGLFINHAVCEVNAPRLSKK